MHKQMEAILTRVQKPARYVGGEWGSVMKDKKNVDLRFAFCFPDTYEVAMSHLGSRILYGLLNDQKGIWCERVCAPWIDMEAEMRAAGIPLYGLESGDPLTDFDIIAFTLQYELSFSNILNMLDLGGIPVLAKERTDLRHIVACGGPCAYNPEPLADFVDLFLIGDGEQALPALVQKYIECKQNGITTKEGFLREACQLEGVYVPRFYDVVYAEDGTIKELCKLYEGAPLPVCRAILPEIETVDFPVEPVIPIVEAVHDRSVVETFRGCTRGCRFCQAGMIYRPVRERSKDKILQLAEKQLKNTGNDELSLLSLSTSDHSCFEALTMALIDYTKRENISLSLPSLRVDKFAFDVLNRIQEYKKSGLTYAPEAGTQRLRDVINKGVTESDIYQSIEQALELGWKHIKLYFMIGLPTETYEDLDGIVEIARNIRELNYKVNGPKGGRFSLTVSVSNFVPKAHTPFQWMAQDTPEMFAEKHNYLAERLKKLKGVTFHYHDNQTSAYEAVFARGDRRCSRLLYEAFRAGCRLDGWTEYFNREGWETAFAKSGINVDFYTTRQRSYDEILPWDIIDSGITKKFLKLESEKALAAQTTRDCRYGCVGCGMNQKVACPMEGIYGK